MDIGRLDKRVEWYTVTSDSDDFGLPIQILTLQGKPWANVRYVTGREEFNSAYTINVQTATLEMRFKPDMAENDVIKFDNKTWNITNIAPTDKGFMNVMVTVKT
ncbi:MAG: head-tail adaptor protein [Vibrio hibernica]